ncbi:acyltransferase [Aneurinibacillus sp. REN35]|uniref:acyltransferase n=1 Tax=Aneurinibacillus sp. REN35 TaxID=3237286 RepID=UPI003527E36D
MKQRIYELDWLRAFAALSVISIHTTSTYVMKSDTAYIWNQAMRYAVPLFIILSGFLLYYSDRNKTSVPYGSFYKRRFSKILIPYVIWTVLYAAYKHWDVLLAEEYGTFLSSLGDHLLYGTGFVHLYFLIIMVQLYLIYPLLYVWLKRHAGSFLAVTLMLTLTAEFILYFHSLGIWKVPRLTVPYVIMLPLWIFYFSMGMYLAQRREKWEPWISGKKGRLGLLYVLTFLLLLIDSKWSGTFDSSIKPTVLLYCFASYFFFYSVAIKAKELRGKISVWVDWLSQQSFLIFLLHPFVLTAFLSKELGLTAFFGTNMGLVLLFLVVTIGTMVATYLISFTPLAPYLGGVRRTSQVSHISS